MPTCTTVKDKPIRKTYSEGSKNADDFRSSGVNSSEVLQSVEDTRSEGAVLTLYFMLNQLLGMLLNSIFLVNWIEYSGFNLK